MVWAHYQYLIKCFIILVSFAIGIGNSQSFKDLKKAAKKVSSKLVLPKKVICLLAKKMRLKL